MFTSFVRLLTSGIMNVLFHDVGATLDIIAHDDWHVAKLPVILAFKPIMFQNQRSTVVLFVKYTLNYSVFRTFSMHSEAA